MRTYEKKRRSPITPIRIFTDEERDNVPEMRHSNSPRLALSTPLSVEAVHHFSEEMLARSPARSDASSSMKSRESALERRVSLLLRSDSPGTLAGADPPRSPSSPCPFDTSLCALPMTSKIHCDQDGVLATDKQRMHKRLSSLVARRFLSPKQPRGQASSPCKPRPNKLTKRTSTGVHTSPATKVGPQTLDSGKSAPSSKPSPSLKDGMKSGLKALTRARTTLISKTSPLLHRAYPNNKPRGGVYVFRKGLQEKATQSDVCSAGFVNPPTSVVFSSSGLLQPGVGLLDESRPPSRPLTSQTLSFPPSERNTTNPSPALRGTVSSLNQTPALLTPDLDELVKRGTTRLRLAPSVRANGHRRLSVTDATNPNLLDVPARRGIDSVKTPDSSTSNCAGMQATGHELRRTTMRIGRDSVLADSTSDCQSAAGTKRPRSSAGIIALKTSHDDVFVDSPQPSPINLGASATKMCSRSPFREIDTNNKTACEDMGVAKTAKALRISVSPRVKGVFNQLPHRRKSSNGAGMAAEPRVSRSHSKASNVLGRHTASKGPLRPPKNAGNAVNGIREGIMSDDELAL